ncbi:MAG: hypothetical protein ACI32F_01220 [Allobaculum sp.]
MSKPTSVNHTTYNRVELFTSILLIIGLIAMGIYSLFIPVAFYSLTLQIAVFGLVIYGVLMIAQNLIPSRKKKSNFFFGGLTILFAVVLLFNEQLPEWIVRTTFGWYCLIVCLAMLVQACINWSNQVRIPVTTLVLILIYGMLGVILLYTDLVDTVNLLRLFGLYFLVLAGRMTLNLIDTHSGTYAWKRGIYIGLPILMGTLLPDAALRMINEKVKAGEDYGRKSIKVRTDEPAKLKAFVHIGSDGFQKVGHFSFSWKGIVYSYGNYDTESYRFFSLLGDGVYFTVPEELYIPNIIKYEHNTLFEYTIQTTPEQDEKIERQLAELSHRSVRWYCQLERKGKATKLGQLGEDYPNRLHYRTGAKFYKIKSGAFKTYWVMGDNCVLFSDVILGTVGADVLSVRGIVTPGSYYDYLENEYQKENSPIISRRVHSFEASLNH